MAKKGRPYQAQIRTYLQGTSLMLFKHHVEMESLTNAGFVRQLINQFLRDRYHVNEKGIQRIRKPDKISDY